MGSTVSALDELRKLQATKQRGAKCTLGIIAKTLSKEDSQALNEALKDELIDSTTISVWMERNGHSVKRHTIARHRRGECRCNG